MSTYLQRVSTAVTVFTVAALVAGTAALPVKVAPSGAAQRRAAMLSAGVDRMPVGTAKGVERAKQARPAKD